MDELVVVGVDPGYAKLGIGVVRFERSATRVLHTATLITSAKLEHEQRLDYFADQLGDVLERWNPVALGYENQAGVEVGMQMRRREGDEDAGTNFSSRKVHEVVGVICCAARYYTVPRYRIAPSSIKLALVGSGRASKQQMRDAVKRFFGVEGSEHAADAIACAVATVRRHRVELASMRRAAALIR